MGRQVPHVEDLATGTPTSGLVPVSAGPGLPPAWGAVGGGSTLLEEFTCVGGEQTVRLPASGSLMAGFKGLMCLVQARSATINGTTISVSARLNGDSGSNYRQVEQYARSNGSGGSEGTTTGFTSINRAYVSRLTPSNAPAGAACSAVVWLPHASRSSFWQPIMSDAVNSYDDSVDTQLQHTYNHWMSTAVVTDITFLAFNDGSNALLSGGFAVGSYFAVYGVQ